MTEAWSIVLAAAALFCVPGGAFLQQYSAARCEFRSDGCHFCRSKNLTRVPEDIPGNVTVLSLGRNNLTSLRNKELLNNGGANIETLFVSFNSLAELEDEAFSGLTKLRMVVLNNNNITGFSKDIFSGNLKLKELYLDGNPLQLPESETAPLLNSASLASLGLAECGLTRLTEGLFSEVPSLKNVYLEGNRLTTVNWLAVNHLSNLTRFEVEENDIRFLSCQAEMVLPLIELNNEESGTLDPVGTNGGHARFVDLSGNPLECDCCLSLMAYALKKVSWFVLGGCRDAAALGRDMTRPQHLKQCYATFLEQYNTTHSDILEQYSRTDSDILEQYNRTDSDILEQYNRTDSDILEQFNRTDSDILEQYNRTDSDILEQYNRTDSDILERI